MAVISNESQIFSCNIANIIPESPLNKMVPLMEDHGDGGGGGGWGAWGLPLAHGLLHLASYSSNKYAKKEWKM